MVNIGTLSVTSNVTLSENLWVSVAHKWLSNRNDFYHKKLKATEQSMLLDVEAGDIL